MLAQGTDCEFFREVISGLCKMMGRSLIMKKRTRKMFALFIVLMGGFALPTNWAILLPEIIPLELSDSERSETGSETSSLVGTSSRRQRSQISAPSLNQTSWIYRLANISSPVVRLVSALDQNSACWSFGSMPLLI